MSDEVCGAECADGTPCENNVDSCPWHNTDDPPETGRETLFNGERAQDAIEAAQEGKSKSGCARAAGVDEATIRNWLSKHDDFFRSFTRARAKGESKLIHGGLHNPNVDASFAKFLLASSFDYVKTDKRELEHSGEIDGFDFTIDASTDD